jgi:KDO2-lipid IV(A) lauroyltransferase
MWRNGAAVVLHWGQMLRRLEYLVVRALLAMLQCMTYRGSLRAARTLARFIYRFDGTPRTRALDNLRLAYGGSLGEAKTERIALGVFETICRHVAEVAHAARQMRRGVRVENPELLTEACKLGRGVVVVSAHMGCWVRMALIPRLLGVRGAVIMKKQRNDVLLQWGIRHLKSRFDMDVIQKKEARDRIVPWLQEGGVVTFFADQHPRKGGFSARFFGLPISAASGPAVYAKRLGCPLLVFTAVTGADGVQILRFEGPVPTDGTHEEISQGWLDLLEARIRAYPDQWMWMHRRWRGPAAVGAEQPSLEALAASD